jgi:hypothetical protein
MWNFTVKLFLVILGGIGGIAIVSLFEGNEVFNSYISGFAAMLGVIIVLLLFITAQLHNIESKKD